MTGVLSSVISLVAGYIVSLQSSEHSSKNDIKEVLDLLTVSELREISSLLHLKVWQLWSILYCLFIFWKYEMYSDSSFFLKWSQWLLMLEWRCDCIWYTCSSKFSSWNSLFFVNGPCHNMWRWLLHMDSAH